MGKILAALAIVALGCSGNSAGGHDTDAGDAASNKDAVRSDAWGAWTFDSKLPVPFCEVARGEHIFYGFENFCHTKDDGGYYGTGDGLWSPACYQVAHYNASGPYSPPWKSPARLKCTECYKGSTRIAGCQVEAPYPSDNTICVADCSQCVTVTPDDLAIRCPTN